MTKWILDTDHYSLIQRGDREVIERFQEIDSSEIYLTIITVQEQIKGRFKNIDEAKKIFDRLVLSLLEMVPDFSPSKPLEYFL
jgi:predicted nucleic acid-binding protein